MSWFVGDLRHGGYVLTGVCLFVCLSVIRITQEVVGRILMQFLEGCGV